LLPSGPSSSSTSSAGRRLPRARTPATGRAYPSTACAVPRSGRGASPPSNGCLSSPPSHCLPIDLLEDEREVFFGVRVLELRLPVEARVLVELLVPVRRVLDALGE